MNAHQNATRGDQPFTWQGKPLATMGALLDGATEAQRDGQATEFIEAYRAYTMHADHNIGYLIGYVEPAERRRELYAAFGISHPIFQTGSAS